MLSRNLVWNLVFSALLTAFLSKRVQTKELASISLSEQKVYISEELPIRKILEYDFRISWFVGAPNGIPKNILGVNGQFPGPTIRGTKGDLLRVRVTNAIQTKENVSIHFHGLHQFKTPFMDGAEQTSQCPLVFGQTQLYEFQLLQTGTHWWHSHHGPTLSDGLWGILIVDNEPEVYKDFYDHEIIISMSEWFLKSGQELSDWYLSPNNSRSTPPSAHSFLMNGHGYYPCEYAEPQAVTCTQRPNISAIFEVPYGSAVRIRFISASTNLNYNISIDNHTLHCIETDGVDTELGDPVDQFWLQLAMRYSFIVNMNAEGFGVGSEFIIRAIPTAIPLSEQSVGGNINAFENVTHRAVYGVIRYVQNTGVSRFANTTRKTNELRTTGERVILDDRKHCIPLRDNSAPDHFDEEIVVRFDRHHRTDGSAYWTTNGAEYKIIDGELPAFMRVMRNEPIPEYMVPIYTSGNGSVIQLVVNNHHEVSHPVHLHGHSFWIVGIGQAKMGDYIAPVHGHLLKRHVPKRDMGRVPAQSWLVLRYVANNPGTWFFHCHVNVHIKGGMAATIVEGADIMRQIYKPIHPEALETCKKAGILQDDPVVVTAKMKTQEIAKPNSVTLNEPLGLIILLGLLVSKLA